MKCGRFGFGRYGVVPLPRELLLARLMPARPPSTMLRIIRRPPADEGTSHYGFSQIQ